MSHRVSAVSILGGRPHLIKAEPIHRALMASEVRHSIVQCQHGWTSDYPGSCSEDFYLPVPWPIIRESRGAVIRAKIEQALRHLNPDVILAYGDLHVTYQALLAAIAARLPVVHIESGYRSRDPEDPEEEVRTYVDHAAAYRIAFTEAMRDNLIGEGIPSSSIGIYGNPALQTLEARLRVRPDRREEPPVRHGLVTFHHHETLNDRHRLESIVNHVVDTSTEIPLTIVLYRRTLERLKRLKLLPVLARAGGRIVSTLRYHAYIEELVAAAFVVTDSSDVQDECAYLGKPCFVIRSTTSRMHRSNVMVRQLDQPGRLRETIMAVLESHVNWVPNEHLAMPRYDDAFVSLLQKTAREYSNHRAASRAVT